MAAALLPPLAIIGAIIWFMHLFVAGPIHLSTMLLPVALVLPFYLLLFYRVSRLLLAWQMDHSIGAGRYQSLLGERLVTIDEDGVTIEHKFDGGFRRWEDVLRVVANGDYGYIYTGADRPTIIPRRCFSDGDEVPFRAFMKAAIIYHWQKETAAKAAAEAAAKEAVAAATAKRPAVEPSLNLTLAPPETENGSDTQWSSVALHNVKPTEVGAETAWLG